MAKEKYKICKNCETLHLVHPNFRDRRPTCFRCGKDGFDMFKGNPANKINDQNNYRPIYCDWNLQHRVEQTAENIASFVINRYGDKKVNPDLLADLKQYLVFAANSTRKGFSLAKDTYL